MASFSLSSSGRHPRFDTIIGLDVAGKMYYCRKSTLLGMGDGTSYFAARFGPDSMMDPQRDHVDPQGREIYFIDRNPEVFRHVLEYLRMQNLPPEIGTFQKNPDVWRALREEAQFYCLDGLLSLLKVTYSCSPDEHGGKGVLHWLGTNKGKDKYMNPYCRDAVDVTGWFDSYSILGQHDPSWGSSDRKEFFVQYRPMQDRPLRGHDTIRPGVGNVVFKCLTGCNHSSERLPVVIDLRKNVVSPTHYSLRYGACRGMDGAWSFEGSTDGETWVLLHAGTNDGHKLSLQRLTRHQSDLEQDWLNNIVQGGHHLLPIMDSQEEYCDYMERQYRHTWEINNEQSGEYFRYFRIIGADPIDGEGRCLHCIGLEIYGHVYEE